MAHLDQDGSPLFGKTDYVEVWKELEMLVEEGLVRNIGVSNFNHTQIDRVRPPFPPLSTAPSPPQILAMCRIKPAVNQVECHPYLTQEKLSAYCKEKVSLCPPLLSTPSSGHCHNELRPSWRP